jgi:hypothetical protein
MTASLQVGDKITVTFAEKASLDGSPVQGMSGSLLGVDEHGIRLDVGNKGIHFLPWKAAGSAVILEEAPKPSRGLGAV